MSLDIELVMFDKAYFDQYAENRVLNYFDGNNRGEVLFDYPRCAEVLNVLHKVLGYDYDLCFCELTKAQLEEAMVIAGEGDWRVPAEMDRFRVGLGVILANTDFDKETIALNWCG